MKKFYIVVNGEQAGPFSLTELEEMRILKSTLAWKEGMDTWLEAGMLEELNSIWKSSPPPLPTLKQKEQENRINETSGFITKNKQQTEKKEKKLLNENEQIKIAKEIKINFYLILISIIIAIISLPIIARKDFKAQSLKQKWEKVKYDENSGANYIIKLKNEIESKVDKQTFFRFSDSAKLFKKYNPSPPIDLGDDASLMLSRLMDESNGNIKKVSNKVDKHRTASENAEYYWDTKNFEYFDYDKFIESTRDAAAINKWNARYESYEYKKQKEYNNLKYQISGLLTPEQMDVQGSGGMCNVFRPVHQNSSFGSGSSVRHWDYDCIFNHYGNVFKSDNLKSAFVVLLVAFIVLMGSRYLFIISKKSIRWVNVNSSKNYENISN